MLFLPTKKDKGEGKLNSLFSIVSDLELLELLNSIVFFFRGPNIIDSMEVIFLILKQQQQNKTKQKNSPG